MCICAYACVCVYTHFSYLFGSFSGINSSPVRTNSPHRDQSLVLIKQNVISEALVKFRGKVGIEIRLALGLDNELVLVKNKVTVGVRVVHNEWK